MTEELLSDEQVEQALYWAELLVTSLKEFKLLHDDVAREEWGESNLAQYGPETNETTLWELEELNKIVAKR